MKTVGNNKYQNDQTLRNYLVIKFHANFKQHPGILSTFESYDLLCERILKLFSGLSIKRLFSSLGAERITELLIKACKSDPSYQPIDLFSYHSIRCSEEIDLHCLQNALLKLEYVELAYIQGRTGSPSIETQTALATYLQYGYLNAAPAGINAKYAWKIKGGKGESNVKFIDIEQGWELESKYPSIQTLPLTGINEKTFGYHGSSVLSVIMMQENDEGYSGITPEAKGYVISQWRPDGMHNDADAILAAVSYLNYGDILLLEAQSYYSGNENSLWPVEIQDAGFAVIRLATALGIIVIEAGGNGNNQRETGNDLDLFESNGKRILNPGTDDFKDSGAIIVAAATSYLPHKRIMYSNYGSRVNCYAWGNGVVIVEKYTESGKIDVIVNKRKLSGTSSASAIIAGAAIAIQGIAESNYNTRLGPEQMRGVLSNKLYGTASENGHSKDKIGVMPDLKKIIDNYLKTHLHSPE